MIDRVIFAAAIMAAAFVAVVVVPLPVDAQPAPLNAPDPRAERSPMGESSEGIHAQTCLRFGMCRNDVRTNPGGDPTDAGLDRSILFAVHGWNSRAATLVFGIADASAYPIFAAAPIALWGGVAADRVPRADAVAGTVALVTGFSTAMVLKRIVGRSRPYATIEGFSSRFEYTGSRGLTETASFPSGHATLAGLIATGAALVIQHPAATTGFSLWAGTVSVSRVWLGVHYPSDVVTGLVLGSGTSLLGYTILR